MYAKFPSISRFPTPISRKTWKTFAIKGAIAREDALLLLKPINVVDANLNSI